MFALVVEVMPPQKIGAAMGITALVIMSASAIGPTFAGILTGLFGWRAIFASFAIILLIGMACAALYMVSPYERTKPHFDVLSGILSVLGFGGLVSGIGVSSLYGVTSPIVITALALGIVCIGSYIIRQLHATNPLLNVRVFCNTRFAVGSLLVMINFGITLSALYILPQFYQNALGMPSSMTGLWMLPGGIVNALISVAAGRMYDRIGARKPALIGFALSLIACMMLVSANAQSSVVYVVASHIVLMIGIPLAMSPVQTFALTSLDHALNADGSTVLNVMQQVFGAIATAAATGLLVIGKPALEAADSGSAFTSFAQSSHFGFAFSLTLALIAFAIAWRIPGVSHVAHQAQSYAQSPASQHNQ